MGLTVMQLMAIEYQLTDRDRQILKGLKVMKCLFTYQIQKLYCSDLKTQKSAANTTYRIMKRLREYGLVDTLVDRMIGGIKAGSAPYIWYLTEQGHRLLLLDNKYPEGNVKRKRFMEPASSTLAHRMAVNECYVQLKDLEHQGQLEVLEASFEPDNWRDFIYKDKKESLKPDLTIATNHHGYECHFFIEMDLSTESLDTITKKCIRYHKYLQTNIEQTQYGFFPIVLFIVKDEKRKQKLDNAIRSRFQGLVNIFLVITADEFQDIMTTSDIPEDRLC